MKSLYVLRSELREAMRMIEYCLREFGIPNRWDVVARDAIRDMVAAKALAPSDDIQAMYTKRLVFATMGIACVEMGRAAELELISRVLRQSIESSFKGPAHLIWVRHGKIVFSAISPYEYSTGRFLAYDVGIYD